MKKILPQNQPQPFVIRVLVECPFTYPNIGYTAIPVRLRGAHECVNDKVTRGVMGVMFSGTPALSLEGSSAPLARQQRVTHVRATPGDESSISPQVRIIVLVTFDVQWALVLVICDVGSSIPVRAACENHAFVSQPRIGERVKEEEIAVPTKERTPEERGEGGGVASSHVDHFSHFFIGSRTATTSSDGFKRRVTTMDFSQLIKSFVHCRWTIEPVVRGRYCEWIIIFIYFLISEDDGNNKFYWQNNAGNYCIHGLSLHFFSIVFIFI